MERRVRDIDVERGVGEDEDEQETIYEGMGGRVEDGREIERSGGNNESKL